jgi:hypothetical protein
MSETSTLSWDLHVHPGQPAEGRGRNGENVRMAASPRAVAARVCEEARSL